MKVLNTEQIAILDFEGRLKVAQRRLTKLYKDKKIKRKIPYAHQPYNYFVNDKISQQLDHVIMANWMYIYYREQYKEKNIFHFSYEQQNDIFRYDAFVGIDNKFMRKLFYIEIDLSNNNFDKVKKYNKYYQQQLYEKEWWIRYATGFPAVVVLTHRKKSVERIIEKENVNGLEFKVYGLELIREIRGLLR